MPILGSKTAFLNFFTQYLVIHSTFAYKVAGYDLNEMYES